MGSVEDRATQSDGERAGEEHGHLTSYGDRKFDPKHVLAAFDAFAWYMGLL